MVEPPRSEPEVPPEPLADEEEEVESDDDSVVPPPEVFMPPGDMDAARRMAVVYIDNLAPFSSPTGTIAEAIFNELPGLHVSMVGSSIGDMYAKFLSPEDRELAMLHQPFHLDGVTFRLVREEDADRIPCDMQWVTLVLARRVGVEHLSQLNVRAAFSCFGETLEVDATTLSGVDCSVVRAVVRLKHARWVPPEVLLTRIMYEPVAVRAMKIRGLKDALGGCTAALQKQVQKHSVLTGGARPLRKHAVAALAASICASAAPVLDGADD
ncbi:hypothetical protein ACQ4PT_043064 [Festuca glaucescens]